MLTARWTVVFALMAVGGSLMVRMPGQSHKGALPPLLPGESAMADRLRRDVTVLAGEMGERNIRHYSALLSSAEYLAGRLRGLGLQVREERFSVEGKEVANIVAEVDGSGHADGIIVIGAHYDSVDGSPGANDNGSGVAALLELARHFREVRPGRTIRFVAFVNEEMPYYRTGGMGSLVHARQARKKGERIVAMLSLETIGCYSDLPKSQHYPALFNLFYPDTGDFIAFVSDLGSRALLRHVIRSFRDTTRFPSEGVAAPGWIEGIGWSDHWSFRQVGYPAVMVTDTAPFRYLHYHEPSDTPDKIDYERMARVVAGLGRVIDGL